MNERRRGPKPIETIGGQGAGSGVKALRAVRKPNQPLFRVDELAPPAEPAPPDQMKYTASEAQRRQPDRPAGWSIGGASPEWEPLDLTGGGSKLPPAADYDGEIADLDLIDKCVVLWMVVNFKLVGLEASPAPQIVMIASRNGLVDNHRVAEGLRLLHRLAMATGTPLDAIKDPFDLPSLLIGKPVKLTIVHKTRDGVPELVVRTIRPR